MNEGMYTVYYRNYGVGGPNSEIIVQIAGVLWLRKNRRKKRPRRRLWQLGLCPLALPRVSREASKRRSGRAALTLSCSRERLSSVGLARRSLQSSLLLLFGARGYSNGCGRWQPGCFRARGEAGGRCDLISSGGGREDRRNWWRLLTTFACIRNPRAFDITGKV